MIPYLTLLVAGIDYYFEVGYFPGFNIPTAFIQIEITGGEYVPFTKRFFGFVHTVKITRMVMDEQNAIVIAQYVLLSPDAKSFTMEVAEFWEIKKGKLISQNIYYDVRPFRNFMNQLNANTTNPVNQ